MGARSLMRQPFLWLAVAALGAATGIAVQLLVGTADDSPVVLVVADAPSALAAGAPPPRAAPDDDASPSSATADQTDQLPGQAVARPAPVAAEPAPVADQQVAPAAQPASAPLPVPVESGLRLRIPALGIDARIVTLGFAGDGQLDVPHDGSSVGWYDISARPGEPGNALLGAHFDWEGSLAVFAGLSRLSSGDLVIVGDGTDETAYEVSVMSSVGWDHPVADVLAAEGTSSSLTLFTCGGAFDSDRSEYDERLIVRAVQVEESPPLAARR